jgi:hypothetical protein
VVRKGIFITILIVALAWVGVTVTQAQGNQPPAPTYVGSDKCKTCHAAVMGQWSQTLHPKMIQDPAKSKDQVILADFLKQSTRITDTKQQFTGKDVVLTMGWRYRQRYIVADPKTNRLVLARGQWNIAGQGPSNVDATWQEAAGGDDWLKECAGCHTTGFNPAKSERYTAADYKAGKDFPFVELGVGCEACHGPASEHLKAPNKNSIPVNKAKAANAQICGACHTRGTSKDDKGETHQYPLGYTPGGDLGKANWTPAKPTGVITDANWWAGGYARKYSQQYLEWQPSPHAAALTNLQQAAAQDACVSCHSTDGLLAGDSAKLADAKFGVTCVACHAPHSAGSKPLDELLRRESYEECTICHNGTLGGKAPIKAGQVVHAPMKEMVEGKGAVGIDGKPSPHFAKDGRAVCASCHMPGVAKSADAGDIATHNLKIAMPGQLDPDMPNACSACHMNSQAAAPQLPAETLQQLIDTRQKETSERVAALEARLKALSEQNQAWLDAKTKAPAEASPLGFKAAFTNLSFVKADGSQGFHNYSYAKAVLDQADKDLKNIEQPPATPTPTSTPAPTETPAPTPTLTPTPIPAPTAAPGSSWFIWGALTAIAIIVVGLLYTQKPKMS